MIHAPNESVDPSEIEHLALAEALFLERYAGGVRCASSYTALRRLSAASFVAVLAVLSLAACGSSASDVASSASQAAAERESQSGERDRAKRRRRSRRDGSERREDGGTPTRRRRPKAAAATNPAHGRRRPTPKPAEKEKPGKNRDDHEDGDGAGADQHRDQDRDRDRDRHHDDRRESGGGRRARRRCRRKTEGRRRRPARMGLGADRRRRRGAGRVGDRGPPRPQPARGRSRRRPPGPVDGRPLRARRASLPSDRASLEPVPRSRARKRLDQERRCQENSSFSSANGAAAPRPAKLPSRAIAPAASRNAFHATRASAEPTLIAPDPERRQIGDRQPGVGAHQDVDRLRRDGAHDRLDVLALAHARARTAHRRPPPRRPAGARSTRRADRGSR